ncbi:ATP-binding protein [Flavobacterium sp. RHBU_24]|uniref:ATP-binding protein n=1 Tax=Flavobacterium sp. RHBU_24 TaxID=3391185 RepID=UPI0039848FF8
MDQKRKIYKLEEIFTPSKPADVTFVARNEINKRIDRALRTSGKQIIIYGFSGVGKTTLLFKKLKEFEINYIKTSCISGMTIQDIIIDAFNQLDVYYPHQKENVESNTVGGNLEASFWILKAGLKAETKGDAKVSQKRVVELPTTPQTLAKFIGSKELVWVIEDFHKIEESHKKQMAQIMKVFMDASTEFSNLKIIAIGAVNSAREVVQYDSEMRSRISEIEVPLMSHDTLKRIIETGERLLNIKFSENVTNRIVTYSSGLPAVTHQLCLLLCELDEIFKTQSSQKRIQAQKFNEAMDEYLEENSDSLKAIFEQATKVVHPRKNENPLDLLGYIVTLGKDNFSILELKESIQNGNVNYKGNNLRKYIEEFTQPERSEILRFNANHNTYYFSNPFIKAYVQCSLKIENPKAIEFKQDFKNVLKEELILAQRVFKDDFGDFDFGDFEDL